MRGGLVIEGATHGQPTTIEDVGVDHCGADIFVAEEILNSTDVVPGFESRYVHQVAISNHRVLKLEQGQVEFEYIDNLERDERGRGKQKVMSLPAAEFIRRWLQHLLPSGFVRIRYYGLHHSSARAETLPDCRAHLKLGRALPVVKELVLVEWLQEILGEGYNCCPRCGTQDSLYRRSEFDELPWLVVILLSLLGQPTRQGVSR